MKWPKTSFWPFLAQNGPLSTPLKIWCNDFYELMTCKFDAQNQRDPIIDFWEKLVTDKLMDKRTYKWTTVKLKKIWDFPNKTHHQVFSVLMIFILHDGQKCWPPNFISSNPSRDWYKMNKKKIASKNIDFWPTYGSSKISCFQGPKWILKDKCDVIETRNSRVKSLEHFESNLALAW